MLATDKKGARLGEIDAFHLALGRAIHAWGNIEEQFGETFVICLSMSPPGAADFMKMHPVAVSILDAVPDLVAKLNLITASLRLRLQDLEAAPEIEKAWTATRQKIANLEEYWAAITRWPVIQELDEDGRPTRALLRPRPGDITVARALTIAAVETFERRFLATSQRLVLLNERIARAFDDRA